MALDKYKLTETIADLERKRSKLLIRKAMGEDVQKELSEIESKIDYFNYGNEK